jgi:hypothetical protein
VPGDDEFIPSEWAEAPQFVVVFLLPSHSDKAKLKPKKRKRGTIVEKLR